MKSLIVLVAFLAASQLIRAQQNVPNTPTASAPVTPSSSTPSSPKPQSIEKQVRKAVVFIYMTCTQDGKSFDSRGTGFWVAYPDERLGKDQGWFYLVTNRHVAECWDETRRPMIVQSMKVRVNLKDGSSTEVPIDPVGWVLPSDDSVDLAILPVGPTDRVDFVHIPTSAFLDNQEISEGDKIMFSGFFYQFPGVRRMEPIVREGILAMVPDEDLITTTGKPGKVYLGDVHIFGGNSGSPVFVDLGGVHGGVFSPPGQYRMLGVVSGMFYEDTDFNLQVTTMMKGTTHGNSGIAMIVPVSYLKDLLEHPRLKARRDGAAARAPKQEQSTAAR